jgi:hypothetical protein
LTTLATGPCLSCGALVLTSPWARRNLRCLPFCVRGIVAQILYTASRNVSFGVDSMSPELLSYRLDQLHIDVARNATDDFNPFHDPHRWHRIRNSPFRAPIALGFQLAALLDFLMERQRNADLSAAGRGNLAANFSNYELRFANALLAGEVFRAEVRSTLIPSERECDTSNRAVLRKEDGTPILIGGRSDTDAPRFLSDWNLSCLPPLDAVPDRTFVADTGMFLKRKFLNNSNAKNFLLGSLIDQFHYFDELSERVRFPAIFTASLISCALLEKAWLEHYDFERNPRVYVSHRISVDRGLQDRLRSNDRLHILVKGPREVAETRSLSSGRIGQETYWCFGLVEDNKPLFRGQIRVEHLTANP